MVVLIGCLGEFEVNILVLIIVLEVNNFLFIDVFIVDFVVLVYNDIVYLYIGYDEVFNNDVFF